MGCSNIKTGRNKASGLRLYGNDFQSNQLEAPFPGRAFPRSNNTLLVRLTRQIVLLALLLVASAEGPGALAQTTLRGHVRDAATGETLPSATVQVEGTFRGTITNTEGAYELRVDSLPATVVARYIGYETARRRVAEGTPTSLDIALTPASVGMEELVVTGETAETIMRQVIARKQVRRERLRTYQADAYNRFTLFNDTGIVSITESLTRLFWDAERGSREIARSQRQTANLDLDQYLPAGLFVTNLYDDEIEVGGYRLVGVTHPEALRTYRFTLDSIRALDGQRVYDLRVQPKSRLASAFKGRIAVLDSAYAMIEAELTPGRAFLFPPPIDRLAITYRQQFSDFGSDVWLPAAFRSATDVKVEFSALLSFPSLHVEQVSRLSNYDLNVPVPDSLYAREDYVAVDSAAVRGDSLLAEAGAVVPLSTREATAFSAIDSSDTLEKAFAPSGLLARFVEISGSVNDEEVIDPERGEGEGRGRLLPEGVGVGIAPQLWFDRVDALNVAARPRLSLGERLRLTGLAGYKTGRREATYGGGVELYAGFADLSADYRYGTAPRYHSRLNTRFTNSATVLLGGDDYFDYLGSERLRLGVERPLGFLGRDARLRLDLTSERQFSVERTTSYDVLGVEERQPPNPPIPEGVLRAQRLMLILGDEDGPLGLFGAKRRLRVSAERGLLDRGSTDLFGSSVFFGSEEGRDLSFTRLEASVDYTIKTFLRRRLLANELRLRLTGGTFTGMLPPQRFGIVEASLRPFTSFGALKTLPTRPYEGEQYAALFWAHNFRTAPFEAAGLYGLARRGWGLILHGGHARTWVSDDTRARLDYVPRVPGGFHHEIGLSLNGVFGLVRLDVSQRLDAPGTVFSIGLAELF